MNLPNTITTLRVALTPVVFVLVLEPRGSAGLLAFLVFLLAALSDLWDGELARKRGQVTDFGKLVDPLADKLLLVATLVPFYVLTRRSPELWNLPVFGGVSLWILIVFFGREILVTALRVWAARRGTVIPARTSGKRKALAQNVFIGSGILWLAFRNAEQTQGWSGPLVTAWATFHGIFASTALLVALLLTIVSLLVYLRAYGRLLRGQG